MSNGEEPAVYSSQYKANISSVVLFTVPNDGVPGVTSLKIQKVGGIGPSNKGSERRKRSFQRNAGLGGGGLKREKIIAGKRLMNGQSERLLRRLSQSVFVCMGVRLLRSTLPPL